MKEEDDGLVVVSHALSPQKEVVYREATEAVAAEAHVTEAEATTATSEQQVQHPLPWDATTPSASHSVQQAAAATATTRASTETVGCRWWAPAHCALRR